MNQVCYFTNTHVHIQKIFMLLWYLLMILLFKTPRPNYLRGLWEVNCPLKHSRDADRNKMFTIKHFMKGDRIVYSDNKMRETIQIFNSNYNINWSNTTELQSEAVSTLDPNIFWCSYFKFSYIEFKIIFLNQYWIIVFNINACHNYLMHLTAIAIRVFYFGIRKIYR